MSLATQPTRTATCAYCDGERDPDDSIEGSYCAPLCYYKHTGQKLLNLIQHDHRWCTNCGRQLKEVEEPTDEQLRQIDGFHSKTAVIGFQYTTPNAGVGFKDIHSERGERVISGVICAKCGNTSHHTDFPEDRERHFLEYGERIFSTLEGKESEHNADLDRETFFEMLIQTRDIVFSLGKAKEGGESPA